MKLLLDFDGTITNVWERYRRIFCDYFELNLDIQKYKILKTKFPDDKSLLANLGLFSEVQSYYQFKRENLESSKYLEMDSLNVDRSFLKSFIYHTGAEILTIRSDVAKTHRQYRKLGLDFLVNQATILKPSGKYTKKDWVTSNCGDAVIIIGDSEYDMAVKRSESDTAIFYSGGIRSIRSVTGNLYPDYVTDNIYDAFLTAFEVQRKKLNAY